MAANRNQAKIVLLGDSGVGKSSIILRFITDTFNCNSEPTIGAQFLSKNVQISDSSVNFQIWDTAGQERYQSLARMYYKDAHAAVLVYDITQPNSWDGLLGWYDKLKENGPENIMIAVAANKDDLAEHENVDIQMVKNFVTSNGFIYTRTSAKEDIGISTMFDQIAKKLYPALEPSQNKTQQNTKLSKQSSRQAAAKKSKSCC